MITGQTIMVTLFTIANNFLILGGDVTQFEKINAFIAQPTFTWYSETVAKA